MKNKFLDFMIVAIVVITIPFAWFAGNWMSVDVPFAYAQYKKTPVSFEQVKDPRPNRNYFHLHEFHLSKKRGIFPIVEIDTLKVIDHGIKDELRN